MRRTPADQELYNTSPSISKRSFQHTKMLKISVYSAIAALVIHCSALAPPQIPFESNGDVDTSSIWTLSTDARYSARVKTPHLCDESGKVEIWNTPYVLMHSPTLAISQEMTAPPTSSFGTFQLVNNLNQTLLHCRYG